MPWDIALYLVYSSIPTIFGNNANISKNYLVKLTPAYNIISIDLTFEYLFSTAVVIASPTSDRFGRANPQAEIIATLLNDIEGTNAFSLTYLSFIFLGGIVFLNVKGVFYFC